MKFLCLHGTGTNSQVFEIQTAALRHELNGSHTYEFVEGTIPAEIAPEILSIFPANGGYYNYFSPSDASVCLQSLMLFKAYVEKEGPFDIVLGFSGGCAAVMTLLLYYHQNNLKIPFRGAVFFSAGLPASPSALTSGSVDLLTRLPEGKEIAIPSAHFWGAEEIWPVGEGEVGWSESVSRMFKAEGVGMREEWVHGGGHEVPGARMRGDLVMCVKGIRRVIWGVLEGIGRVSTSTNFEGLIGYEPYSRTPL
ncbi:uncharacterized protein BDR25DRAFT_242558 [Lindgomyces ingoldianus]|uniref:Uncharacterized protein n=1 Tax=Lindgomyces ingoldianus TaxID=673940 RepID=A0ACB6QD47_9PLEO|nr:uncharacterized protein BDR25DRAFT_242558 [Lindgomyces ingoldianus]KAF2464425.1 hypothetical protein BDR25DRAFT_242558 [Lindgomyces ingoldianus]